MSDYRPAFSAPAPAIFGCGAIDALGTEIERLGCRKPLIICDCGVEAAGILKRATDSLEASGIGYAVFNRVISDPPDSIVDDAGAQAVSEGADCLIGLGGGSSMDTAKAAAIYMFDPGPVKRYILQAPTTIDTKIPVVLVPTTSGTGSECTRVAIISRPDMNTKWSAFVNTSLAIIDPELTLGLPKGETAATGLDALSHAIEAMTTVNWNHHSDLFAEGAIQKIWKNLYTAWSEPSNLEARSEMSLAANWAGFAFNNPITHVGHASADAFSCAFHTPHGLGCALALPETVALVAPVMPDRIHRIAAAMGLPSGVDDTPERLGKRVADELRVLMHKMEMPSLRALGHTREQVTALAQDVVGNHLSSYCPVPVTREVAEALLGRIYDTYQ